MKILIIGFLTLFCWSALSTHLYVCNIRGLCNEPMTGKIITINPSNTLVADTIRTAVLKKQVIIPENLVTYFAFDKYEFHSDMKTDNYLKESNAFLNQNSQSRLKITGYTDEVGSDLYNDALGFRRALSVQYYFVSKGVPADKILLESMGEKQPSDNNYTIAGRANNRRTVITIKN